MSIEERLASLGIRLSPPPPPVASYVPAVRIGNLMFLSGVVPRLGDEPLFKGKLGKELDVDAGYKAAREAAIQLLAVLKSELGSLDRVKRVVRLAGYVASAEGFTEQPKVVNGASELLIQVFGERGKHSRVALGVAELPLGAPVEIEAVVEVE